MKDHQQLKICLKNFKEAIHTTESIYIIKASHAIEDMQATEIILVIKIAQLIKMLRSQRVCG